MIFTALSDAVKIISQSIDFFNIEKQAEGTNGTPAELRILYLWRYCPPDIRAPVIAEYSSKARYHKKQFDYIAEAEFAFVKVQTLERNLEQLLIVDSDEMLSVRTEISRRQFSVSAPAQLFPIRGRKTEVRYSAK